MRPSTLGLTLLIACGGEPSQPDTGTEPSSTGSPTGTPATGTPTGSPTTPLQSCADLAASDPSASSGTHDFGLGPVWCDLDTPGSIWTRRAAPLRTMGAPIGGQVEGAIADPDVWITADGTWHIAYQGSRGAALLDPLEMMIVHGSSPDGVSWTVDETPLLTSPADPTAWDATHSETPSVVHDPSADPGTEYKLYYSGAAGPHPAGDFSWYQVGVALSSDGVTYTRLPAQFSAYGEPGAMLRAEDVLADVPGVTGGVVADPDVVIDADGTYHLFVSSYGHDDALNTLAWGITHLVSPDGIFWSPGPDGARPTPELTGQQPSVGFNPATGLWELVFTEDTDEERLGMPSTFNPSMGVWLATSPDLETWTVAPVRDFWWDGDNPEETYGLLTGAALAHHGGQRHLFYTGWGSNNVPEGSYTTVVGGYQAAALNLLLASQDAD